jgi:diadenosine tetraphosphate (Ap4A) HIT family hydrolase
MAYYFSPFRKKYGPPSGRCPFCDPKIIKKQTILDSKGKAIENKYYRWMVNYFPKFEGHTMVVPKRHLKVLGTETPEEIAAREELINIANQTLQKAFPGSGLEVFLQTGAGSQSSIEHLHWHVVPASSSDKLRSFAKLGHFYTTKQDEERVLIFPMKIERSPVELKKELKRTLTGGSNAKKGNGNGRR